MSGNTIVRLLAAREAIKTKQYNKARKLLEGIDHPQADVWLAKIEQDSSGNKGIPREFFINGAAFILAIIILIVAVIAPPSLPNNVEMAGTIAVTSAELSR